MKNQFVGYCRKAGTGTMKISKENTMDLISSFFIEINKTDESEAANILKKHIGIFADYIGVDFIMLLQPIVLLERHEFLYSPISEEDRIKLVKDFQKLGHRRRVEFLSTYETLTHITDSKNNTTPLIDSNIFKHIYIYPIINKYKNEIGNGGIFYVNKNHEIEMDELTRESMTHISESIMIVYNKYRLYEMYKYNSDMIEKMQASLNSAFFIFDYEGILHEVNKAFTRLVEKPEEECLGHSVFEVLALDNHNTSRDYAIVSKDPSTLPEDIPGKDPNAMYVDYVKEDGTHLILKKYFTTIYKEPTIFRMVILENITDELNNMEKMRFQGYHDALTGLHNRNYFIELTEKLTASPNTPLAVIVGDINGLKLINDIFGHAYGDDVIQKIADALKNNLANGEILRMGGDEFYVFLYDADENEAQEYITKVNEECKKLFKKYDFVGISLGFCISRGERNDIDYYIRKAEAEMYYFKSINSENLKSKSIDKFKNIYEENYDVGAKRSKRLTNLASDFAKWLGLRKNESIDLCTTMELSDIGKVALDEKVLKSGNPLESMKTHCRVGYKIASLSYETSHLARIILNHHENWDGSGFPQGLKGSEIPFLSRVVSLIEYYDDRLSCTKCAKSDIDGILDEIEQRKGTVFDPVLADRFIDFIRSREI